MKKRECTVVHVSREVAVLSRAGRHAGVTNVAKLCRVTIPRARKMLTSAYKLGMLRTYKHQHRINVNRICYSITDLGLVIVDAIDEDIRINKEIDRMFGEKHD